MTSLARYLYSRYRMHGMVVAYMVLALGLVGAVWMIDREATRSIKEDRVIRVEIDKETKARVTAIDQLLQSQEQQIRRLQMINAQQNAIIRTLLKVKRRNPDIFTDIIIPAISGGGLDTTVRSTGVSGGGSNTQGGVKPRPTKPRPPKQEITSPTPQPNNPISNPPAPPQPPTPPTPPFIPTNPVPPGVVPPVMIPDIPGVTIPS